jgi:hypothetical protein
MAATGQSATSIGVASMEELASIPDASEVNRPPVVGRDTSATGVPR